MPTQPLPYATPPDVANNHNLQMSWGRKKSELACLYHTKIRQNNPQNKGERAILDPLNYT